MDNIYFHHKIITVINIFNKPGNNHNNRMCKHEQNILVNI